MTELWPRLGNIFYRQELLSRTNYEVAILSDPAYRAVLTLVAHTAAAMVWTYSPPTDGLIPDDDLILARVTALSKRSWKRVRPEIVHFFDVRRGFWGLRDEYRAKWIVISDGNLRGVPSARVMEIVSAREGHHCTYCGATTGPFDYDHILPVSRGGTHDPSNLTLACATCNRSKGGKTLAEWFAWRAPRGSSPQEIE